MLFILAYSLIQAQLLFYFFKFKKNQIQLPTSTQWEDLPKVTVQLPIFNERYVIERLLDSVANLNYPKEKLEIQILDDSTDDTSLLIRKMISRFTGINFKYIHRKNRAGFKAGALKEGLAISEGELIAIFDADFVPDPEFLLKSVVYFCDPKVGMLQTRWTHINENYSLLTRLQAFALDTHFLVEQMGRSEQKVFINFNGTGGIWRKSCIYDAGNWQDDTITEDLDLSYRAQKKGWKFLYRPEILSPSELPPIMSAIKSQQFRWTKGGAECAVKHLGSVLNSSLSLRTKLHATAHLLNSFIFIAVLLVSIRSIPIWLAFQYSWIPDYFFKIAAIFLVGFVIIAMVYFFANLSLVDYSRKGTLKFLWELPLFLSVSMGMSLHNAQAVWEGLTGKKSTFVRTPKFNLEANNGSWNENIYNQFKIPLITYVEGILSLVFVTMVFLAFYFQTYEMLAFHFLLALGFGLVSLSSFNSYRKPT